MHGRPRSPWCPGHCSRRSRRTEGAWGGRSPGTRPSTADFNYDFHVMLDETVAPVEYNYTDKATLLEKGERYFTDGESHGLSVFLCDGNGVLIRRSISNAASPVPRHGRSLRSSDR